MEITNKYHNGKIYKITDIAYNKYYIGSTTEELSQRMARHRADFKKFLRGGNIRHVRSYGVFNEYGVENCKIELIEYYKCDTSAELKKREGEHIKNNECVNKCVAGRTKHEYYDDNKDKQIQQKKEYYENNKNKINEYSKEYHAINKDTLKQKQK